MTRTQRILAREGYRCRYCGGEAQHADHIVSKNDRRRYPGYDGEEFIVAACKECNWRKLTRRLAPTQELADELNARMVGPRWQTYAGGQVPEVKFG